ncbi:hypothetical protein IH601_10445, partial [Candidatus Bipolaricaulota bacterium]|nr:hypothetical protein [Candidatus Bipolaricaulota bacterium]
SIALPATPSTTAPDDSTPIWNTITPDMTLVEEPDAFPWWLGLLGVAALVIVMYVIGSSQSAP